MKKGMNPFMRNGYIVLFTILLLQSSIQTANANGDFYSGIEAIRSYPTGETPMSLATHALNKGARYAIAIANYSSQSVSIYLSNNRDPLVLHKEVPIKGHPSSVTFGDFNHDFILDLATANPYENTISILLPSTTGEMNEVIYNIDVKPSEIIAEDLNGDGFEDDLIILSHSSSIIYVLFVQKMDSC